MIRLKQVIHDTNTNSVEATWVDEITPAIEVPESIAPDTVDEDGNVIPGVVTPAYNIPAVEVQVRSHSYADVQMQMLRDDIAQLGGDVKDYEKLINDVELDIIPISITDTKLIKINSLKDIYQDTIAQPVSYMDTVFQADPSSVNTLVLSLAALTPLGTVPDGFYWLDINNNKVPMTLAQLQGLAATMYSIGWSSFKNLQDKKDSVITSKSKNDIESINF